MPKMSVLVEVESPQANAFETHEAALASASESKRQAEQLVSDLVGLGLEIVEDHPPVPLFSEATVRSETMGFAAFASPTTNPDVSSATIVVAARVDRDKIEALKAKPRVKVWPNSTLSLLDQAAAPAVDCRPFRPPVTAVAIRDLLDARTIWQDGFRGQETVVGIIDEGVNGEFYPVTGGFSRPTAQAPGTAMITSHGSMCAADVLIAAPWATIYDYPFLGVPNSGGALIMFQAVLDQRRRDGTPHLTSNSYGFVGVPPRETNPNHEIWDINHPLHRKIREVIASGAPAFFAAGNCGQDCPSGNCQPSGIGPARSISASNSLSEVITVAAVNSQNQRIGYSSQGPGMFEPHKPDISSYSHFFGNFGPGRPGGTGHSPFDNGTSAATPVAAGVGALLMSALGPIPPALLGEALIAGAIDIGLPGWDEDTGHGVLNAAASYRYLIAQWSSESDVPEVAAAIA
jgi:serine protease AprX